MCFGCLRVPPGTYTDDNHQERDKKLFEMIEFYTRLGKYTRDRDPRQIKTVLDDLKTKHQFSYHDFMNGTNTVR